jgi:hypothetical protein
MQRKLFPPLPDFAKTHPKALEWRVDRIEEHLEQSPQSSSGLAHLPASIVALILWLCGLLGLVSPETAANVLKALGH